METESRPAMIDQVASRVAARLPEISIEAINEAVAGLFQRYADSKIQNFLPILVEREAVTHLRSVSTTVAALVRPRQEKEQPGLVTEPGHERDASMGAA